MKKSRGMRLFFGLYSCYMSYIFGLNEFFAFHFAVTKDKVVYPREELSISSR